MYWFNFIWIMGCFGLAMLSTILGIGLSSLCDKITNNKENSGSLAIVTCMIISYIALIVGAFAPYNNFYNWGK